MPKVRQRSTRRGERTDAIIDSSAAALDLSRAGTERALIDRGAQHVPAIREALDAQRQATKWLERQQQTFGALCQLRLRPGRPLEVVGSGPTRYVAGTEVQSRADEDGISLDLVIEQPRGRDLLIESVSTSPVGDSLVLLSAIRPTPVVPGPRTETVRYGPHGLERVVWDREGRVLTLVGDRVLPNRIARFV